MTFLVKFILPYLLLYKYWAIFAITFVAALAFPVPPGTLLMASAAFASQGYLSFFWIVVVGVLGNVAGDNVCYFLARRYGRPVLIKIGLRKILESDKYQNIEQRLQRRPGWLIFVTRFEVVSNLCVNIICGLGKVPYKKFLLNSLIGEIAQITIYCTIGYFVGDNWLFISAIISKLLLVLTVAAVILIVIYRKRIWKRITSSAS